MKKWWGKPDRPMGPWESAMLSRQTPAVGNPPPLEDFEESFLQEVYFTYVAGEHHPFPKEEGTDDRHLWKDLGISQPVPPCNRGFKDKFQDHRQGDFLLRESLVLPIAAGITALGVKRYLNDLEECGEDGRIGFSDPRRRQEEFFHWATYLGIRMLRSVLGIQEKKLQVSKGESLFAFRSRAHCEEYAVDSLSHYFGVWWNFDESGEKKIQFRDILDRIHYGFVPPWTEWEPRHLTPFEVGEIGSYFHGRENIDDLGEIFVERFEGHALPSNLHTGRYVGYVGRAERKKRYSEAFKEDGIGNFLRRVYEEAPTG